jgi:hypothetical protein
MVLHEVVIGILVENLTRELAEGGTETDEPSHRQAQN